VKTLFATAEFGELARVGGLGAASAGLVDALHRLGTDVRVLMPAYVGVVEKCPPVKWLRELPGLASVPGCRIGQVALDNGVVLYLVDSPPLYNRQGTPYGSVEGVPWPDDHLRWARLSLAAAQIASGGGGVGWIPDLVHCNDWPTGLAPAYMRWAGIAVPSIMTIHNIAHHGVFPAEVRGHLGIPETAFRIDGVEFHGGISFLKAGSFYADHVTTVSPTYAREITTPEFGCGLHGLMATRARAGTLSGVLNGLDESWNAGTDPHLPFHFSSSVLDGKRGNADVMRTGLCLRPSNGPLFGIVARLVHQKGLDLVAGAAKDIVDAGGQIAILGLGSPEIEALLSRTARAHRDDIGLLIGFNDLMARRVIAGSDFFLMPSRFEPCGLTQMQAQRYGALPVAHATGGLVDTVEDGNTGLLFSDPSVEGVRGACHRAFEVFADPPRLSSMRRAAMAQCFSWRAAALAYATVYDRACGRVDRRPVSPHPIGRRVDTASVTSARVESSRPRKLAEPINAKVSPFPTSSVRVVGLPVRCASR
jgi:starch synthase